MTIEFRILGMKGDSALRRQLEADLTGLHRLMGVTSARVALQHQRETTPPYQAVAMLGVAGPDIQAAARDHTWSGAWSKVMARLREQIEERRARPKDRQTNRSRGYSPGGDRAKH